MSQAAEVHSEILPHRLYGPQSRNKGSRGHGIIGNRDIDARRISWLASSFGDLPMLEL
jgi:hypothetical protein